MDGGSLTEAGAARSTWKLDEASAPLAQGIVASGFGMLPSGRALLLRLPDPCGGAWIAALEAVAPVTSAVPPKTAAREVSQATALALTWTGLCKCGLPEASLSSFSRAFREGMFQEDRLRRLGDRRREKWLDTVLPGGPLWSANTPPVSPSVAMRPFDVRPAAPERLIATPLTVDALILIYTRDAAAATTLAQSIKAALEPLGVAVQREIELMLDAEGPEGSRFSREHFGFADGLSQPEPFDAGGAVTLDGRPVREPHPVQGVPLGEFLLGYTNGHREVARGPVVADKPVGVSGLRPGDLGLEPHPEARGFYDFGRNGSYLVVRELRQDVAAFWRSMEKNAAAIRKRDPEGSAHVTAQWLAERVIGRSRDGHLLRPDGATLAPNSGGDADNDYLFFALDKRGLGCPLGSHVRRANPRDALAMAADAAPTLLAAANNHRILRRGRKFGPKAVDHLADDGAERGLLFVCLNTSIARQFEFVQQTWLLNSDFATLCGEVDPLVGPDGRMTIPEKGLRRSIHVETFVQMAGGDYFFLPGLPALRYLAQL